MRDRDGVSPGAAPGWPFDPARERYVSLATRRRDGREVLTPVWVVGMAGRAYVYSAGGAGKVKRLRTRPGARMAACSMRGAVRGEWVAVRGGLVRDRALCRRAMAAMRAKYGWQMRVADVLARLAGQTRHRVVLEFELEG